MNKFAYVVAAVVSFAVAAPTIASAQTVVIKNGHHGMGARAEFRDHHRHDGWRHHHRHHHNKVVIIKHRH